MQIGKNPLGMSAGITVATDKDGREYYVVVVKGTFSVLSDGQVRLAEQQEPLVYADQHYGEPNQTSIQYECDFARFKRRTDVLVNGNAVSPRGKAVTELTVSLEIGNSKKEVKVFGDRKWERGLLGFHSTPPESFESMPLVFERAFGGSDHSHESPKHQGTELRNPVGVGFHKNSTASAIEGKPLPNLEDSRHPISKWSDRPPPAGVGFIGRNWQPRVTHAGTYDERWMQERLPFLPADFDDQYFQAALQDQQFSYLQGGETVRCTNMTPEGVFSFVLAQVNLPLWFRFRDRPLEVLPNLDTLVVEPGQRRYLATWRAAVPVGRKLNALREIGVGKGSTRRVIPDKPHYESLEDLAYSNRLFGPLKK